MNELMRAEILDQPQAIEESLPQLRSQLAELSVMVEPNRHVVFTGSGDSYFAPLALLFAARLHLSSNVHTLPALEAAQYWPYSSSDILVSTSVSGRAARTVEAAKKARDSGATVLAITSDDTSPLAQVSSETLLLPFKSRSRITPHTTDYLTSLLAVATVIERMAETEFDILDTLVDIVRQVVTHFEQSASSLGNRLQGKEQFYFLGGGPHFATATYTAAKFWEAGGLRAVAFDLEEFAHGPHLVVDSGNPIFIIAPRGGGLARAKQIVSGLKELAVDLYVVTDVEEEFPGVQALIVPEVPEEWSPFTTAIPLQWLAWTVATAKEYDVLKKDGRHDNPELYEAAHRQWVR